MVVGPIFTKKRNFDISRANNGLRVNFHEKGNLGFFPSKSWLSGQFSRKNVISVFFRVTHGRRVKFHEKCNFGIFHANHGRRVNFDEKRNFGFFHVTHGRRVKFHEKV
jgi:hypothetical protein